jgi:hypothetical protein
LVILYTTLRSAQFRVQFLGNREKLRGSVDDVGLDRSVHTIILYMGHSVSSQPSSLINSLSVKAEVTIDLIFHLHNQIVIFSNCPFALVWIWIFHIKAVVSKAWRGLKEEGGFLKECYIVILTMFILVRHTYRHQK